MPRLDERTPTKKTPLVQGLVNEIRRDVHLFGACIMNRTRARLIPGAEDENRPSDDAKRYDTLRKVRKAAESLGYHWKATKHGTYITKEPE